jgi:hypothetical protein
MTRAGANNVMVNPVAKSLTCFLLVMISKYCAKIINVWNFSEPIVELMHSEFSGKSLPSMKGTFWSAWSAYDASWVPFGTPRPPSPTTHYTYIDTNNRQGMKLSRFKNRTPARFWVLVMISKYCAKIINVWDFSDPIVEVMHSEFSGPSLPSIQRRVPFLKDSSFRSCFCFVHTIAQFSRILRFSHIYCQIFRRVPYVNIRLYEY